MRSDWGIRRGHVHFSLDELQPREFVTTAATLLDMRGDARIYLFT
jgi:hypothetical protein